ncbi:hypothetical protein SAY86_026503 [Trapa natans]|uniref:Reticulon-like protein n=1 Tax=Trapa natans TaxID=22666 RepID=A0AAN7KIN2_TRANT|nr:hypothetical protein SAY86_026503 [Trapa natans]
MDACVRRSPSSSSAPRSPGGVNISKSSTASSGAVAAGSVWETRMRNDEVRGGIKVFNGGGEAAEGDNQRNVEASAGDGKDEGEKLPSSNNGSSPAAHKGTTDKRNGLFINGVGKRKTWKSDQSSADGPGAQIPRPRNDQLSVNEKSPGVQAKKGATEKSSILGRKLRSEPGRSLHGLRKVKSDSGKGEASDAVGGSNSTTTSRAQLRKTKSDSHTSVDEVAESVEASENKGDVESGSDGICKEIEVYGAKTDTSSSDQDGELPGVQSTETNEPDEDEEDGGGGGGDDDEYSEDEEEEENEEEILNEETEVKRSENSQEIPAAEPGLPPHQEPEQTAIQEKQSLAIEKLNPASANMNKQRQINEKPKPIIISTNANRQTSPPNETIKHNTTTSNCASRAYKNMTSPNPSKPLSTDPPRTSTVRQNYVKPRSYGYQSIPETQNKLHNLVDLVMWRDVSKSAFVFGFGAFAIISSSYTRDLNISFITVISYLGLVYLGATFLYRSIIFRGYVDIQHTGAVLREDEAIWLLRLVLPYMNEFLLKIRTLFSGDPATTMKMAVLLFVMARCGSSITIWKMAKLGFFGAFTVPKVCSSYSTQISAHGKFWVLRFRDAWDSCSHKKAVAIAVFTLIWNMSSVVARIWAAFMLFVAFRYYQQSLVTVEDDCCGKDAGGAAEATWQGRAMGGRRGGGATTVEPTKERKTS